MTVWCCVVVSGVFWSALQPAPAAFVAVGASVASAATAGLVALIVARIVKRTAGIGRRAVMGPPSLARCNNQILQRSQGRPRYLPRQSRIDGFLKMMIAAMTLGR